MTGAEALAVALPDLRAAGIDTPLRDARLLLAHALNVAPGRLTLHLQDTLGEAEARAFFRFIQQRAARRPVSQIVGGRLFFGRWFQVTPDVLDPRPETETLVALALEHGFERVLDLGTGSGAILLTLLAERPGATGVGTDISQAALAVAARNAAALEVAARAMLIRADWFAGVAGRFDLVVCNPPYIAADEMAGLLPEVRAHEPHAALSPGGDGLDAYRAIAAGVREHLTPNGRLMVEIGPTQGGAVAALFAAVGLENIAVHPDLDQRDRVVSAQNAV